MTSQIDDFPLAAVNGDGTQEWAVLPQTSEPSLKYLAFLSHDMNNNLGSISLQLKLLRDRLAEPGGFAEEMEVLDTAVESIQHTTDGMRRLLTYQQVRRQGRPVKLEPVDLNRLVKGVVTQSAPQARNKGIDVRSAVPPDAAVTSDGDLIVLVLQNLVGNAVKYSSGGTVRLTARRSGRMPEEQWCLMVSDQGPGIHVAQVGHIFDAFWRGEPHGQDGAGLGLAIAYEAAARLGAELSVRSKAGVGSTFRLVLPAGRSRAISKFSGPLSDPESCAPVGK
ncbi:MAG: histidine kinase [Phycisphaerales bacterium]|nr:histidine kinase [Phycisphaerales bacterium]